MRRLDFHIVVPGGRRGVRWLHLAIGVAALLLLAACGGSDDPGVEEDRRFATDPEPIPTETVSAATSTIPPAIVTVTPTRPSASPEASPEPITSDVQSVVMIDDGSVVSIDVDTGSLETIAGADEYGDILLAIPDSSGSLVAIIAHPADRPEEFDLTLIDLSGKRLQTWTNLESTLGAGNGKDRGTVAGDWDAASERIAVVFPNGGGVVADLDGSTRLLLTRRQAPAPTSVAWSPDNEAIAFTSRDLDDDSPYLAIGGARVLPLDPVRIAGTGGSRPIHSIVWSPDGETLLAVQGSSEQGDEFGGDLIQIDRRSLAARFALGGSRFGPGAEIVSVVPAPDGASWGVVTVAPGRPGSLEASVWGATGEMTNVVKLDLGENPPVAEINWTQSGITVTLIERDEIWLASFEPNGQAIAVATPSASPEALASPVALPPIVGSPEPDASPER